MVSKGVLAGILALLGVGAVAALVLSKKATATVAQLVLQVTPTTGVQFLTLFSVRVLALDAAGNPVVGAKIVVTGPWSGVLGTTDATGVYQATTPPAVVPGTTDAIAAGPGAVSNSVPITVTPFVL